jgi:NAD(P)-dependent dehydrogenase (short-subunit alcohol dehydrogenase family)
MDTSTWLLTGASSGLGYALADYVLNQGDRVVPVSGGCRVTGQD